MLISGESFLTFTAMRLADFMLSAEGKESRGLGELPLPCKVMTTVLAVFSAVLFEDAGFQIFKVRGGGD